MSKQRVLLLGATGETGGSILEGLLEQSSQFDVELLVRPASAGKASVKKLADRVSALRIIDINGPVEDLVAVLRGVDVVISAIDALSFAAQKNLATAAKQAGVKRFLPCMFATIMPPGGIMILRDSKEEIIQHIRKLYLPYTFVDVGWWYQIGFPTVPSGRLDYATNSPSKPLHGNGDGPLNLYTDLADIGRFVARIIADPRTLNKYVVAWGEQLTEHDIWRITEEVTGEKITARKYVPHEETLARLHEAEAAVRAAGGLAAADGALLLGLSTLQYENTMFVRGDNCLEYAKYLGYLDARELFPDLRPKSFREFLEEVLAGKGVKPYQGDGATAQIIKAASGKAGKA
ncbi:hypothetical protein B0J12DRAFT_645805 [Macrophomina phaseolina]|uniref:NmrA-like domain-containing protein n=1 Tax=Macrophomina phaseolina TaxID=35725 RepID=A0ABQ8GQX7_9PEZI|nr:hypothetical protein B0J12DRAFT_645805 [Macrophomina phaseolina]